MLKSLSTESDRREWKHRFSLREGRKRDTVGLRHYVLVIINRTLWRRTPPDEIGDADVLKDCTRAVLNNSFAAFVVTECHLLPPFKTAPLTLPRGNLENDKLVTVRF